MHNAAPKISKPSRRMLVAVLAIAASSEKRGGNFRFSAPRKDSSRTMVNFREPLDILQILRGAHRAKFCIDLAKGSLCKSLHPARG